jgi:hypothetical protein
MAVKDLPLNNVAGFTGTIGDFIQIEERDGAPFKVTINPGQPETKLVDNVTDASDYTIRAMGAAFDYRFLQVGKHLKIEISKNIGFSRNAGVIKSGGQYQNASANGPTLIPTGVPVVDSRERKSLTAHLVLDTILENTVVVDMDYLRQVILDESQLKQAQGGLNTLRDILNQPDIPSAQKLRGELMAASKGRRQEWRTIRNMAESPAFVKPASLPATVDGVEVDVYSLPPCKLYRLNQDGSPAKVSCNWDHSPLSIKWVQTQTGKGCSLATKNALVSAKLLSE